MSAYTDELKQEIEDAQGVSPDDVLHSTHPVYLSGALDVLYELGDQIEDGCSVKELRKTILILIAYITKPK